MKKPSAKWVIFLRVLEMGLALLCMAIALSYADSSMVAEEADTVQIQRTPESALLLALTYLALGGMRLLRAFRLRKSSGMLFGYLLASGAVFIGCAALVLFAGQTEQVCMIVNAAYWIILLIGRIQCMIRKHTWRSVLLNVLVCMVIAVYLFAVLMGVMVLELTMYVVGLQALYFIMEAVFSQVRMDVLKKIVRKTYASEILFGLLLLIVAISFVLSHTEENLADIKDALWYCFAIVTTIGFGDYTATSLLGRTLSVILGVYGIVVVALITSIIVNFYGETKKIKDEDDEEEEEAASADQAARSFE